MSLRFTEEEYEKLMTRQIATMPPPKIAGKAPNRIADGKTEDEADNTLAPTKKSSHRTNMEFPCPKEEEEQVALAQFLDLMFWDEWFHVPNGGMRPSSFDKDGKRFSVEAAKMKKQGVKTGIPDVWIIRPTPSGAPGVVIELKRIKGGVVSEDQKKWLKTLENFGWVCYVGKGAEKSIQFIKEIYKI
jgi:hypothetical protein